MKLIALLSFFAEDEEYIVGDLRDLHKLGVTSVVAVDGAYAMYPDGPVRSGERLIEKLRSTAESLDMSLLLYQPNTVWMGNEVEKRQVMIDLAWTIADKGDWFVVWDCDYKLVDVPEGPEGSWLPIAGLPSTKQDFAYVSFTESSQDNAWHPMQMFIKAQPVMMDGNHHTYKLADGRRSQILRRPVENMAEARDMSQVKIRHRVYERDDKRRAGQTAYYVERDRLGLET
jgi:hypothetical protein